VVCEPVQNIRLRGNGGGLIAGQGFDGTALAARWGIPRLGQMGLRRISGRHRSTALPHQAETRAA